MLENEIASLTGSTWLPTCFQTNSPRRYDSATAVAAVAIVSCASFPFIITIILVNPCSCLHPFLYEFIVKVK